MKGLMRFLALSILYFIIALYHYPTKAHQYQLAVCAIFQNEGRFLKEWIEFNMLVGVEHFYLYNNYSTDNYAEILKPYIDAGIVDCVDWNYSSKDFYPARLRFQSMAYNDCLNKIRGHVKWLMVIDLDEFLFPVECSDLREFLKDYEDYAAVCANWIVFGTSHVRKIPANKLLIESLILRSSLEYGRNRTIKSIIQPEKVQQMGIHRATKMFPGFFQINTNKEPFEGRKTPVCLSDKLRINHYWVRDEEFLYGVKLPRLIGRRKTGWSVRSEDKFHFKLNGILNAERDSTIYKYVRLLRKKMFGTSIKPLMRSKKLRKK